MPWYICFSFFKSSFVWFSFCLISCFYFMDFFSKKKKNKTSNKRCCGFCLSCPIRNTVTNFGVNRIALILKKRCCYTKPNQEKYGKNVLNENSTDGNTQITPHRCSCFVDDSRIVSISTAFFAYFIIRL